MSKKEAPKEPTRSVVMSFVFNSPVLVPWSVVEPYQDKPDELADKVDIWEAANMPGYRFKESEAVVECSNPTLKMTIRRILREKGKDDGTGEQKKRLIGFECYWFVSVEEASAQSQLMSIRANRRVPVPIEEE